MWEDFKLHSYLIQHQIIHSDLKPYECKQCEKTDRVGDLKTHKSIHAGEKPYEWNVEK